ncbi:hypothetical protein [Streptomyces scopuliridis]|uniref:hypothetical protein n=1 Tax=Streptomyces scopuliridis TaxID=452529 RepID=UPI003444290C
MNISLPDPMQPTAEAARRPALDDEAEQLIDAVNEALATRYRDETPVPVIGTTPPVPQPGRPPMSQKATDASALMLSAGIASLPLGAAATGILWASGHADPVVIACICAAPATLILALSRLLKHAKDAAEAAPPEHHYHYTGTVIQDQRSINTQTRGLIATTRNRPGKP